MHAKVQLVICFVISSFFFVNVEDVRGGLIISSSFNGVTDGSISTAGTDDWGYVSVSGGFFDSNLGGVGQSYSDTLFGSLANNAGAILTSVSSGSSIGAVTFTEGTTGTDTVSAQGNVPNYVFDGNQAHGSYGNFAPNEQDIWGITFNDLGVGTSTIRLYMGHSAVNRVFDMDVSLTDGGAPVTMTTVSPQLSTLGSTVAAYGTTGLAYTYDVEVSTTTPDADLTLTFGGISGGFGGAILSGYTVSVIPEPGSLALFLVGGLALLLRCRAWE